MRYLTATNRDLHNSTALTCSVCAVQLTRGDAVTCSCGGSRNENQRRSPGGGDTHTHRGPLNALISMLNRSCILHHTHHAVLHTHSGMSTEPMSLTPYTIKIMTTDLLLLQYPTPVRTHSQSKQVEDQRCVG